MSIALVTSVYNNTVTILTYIDNLNAKAELACAISAIVIQIRNATVPLRFRSHLDPIVRGSLESLKTALEKTLLHLKENKESVRRHILGFIAPGLAVGALKDCRQRLMDEYLLLMGAMQVVDHVKGYNLVEPIGAGSRGGGMGKAGMLGIGDPPPPAYGEDQVTNFWDHYIGFEHWQRVGREQFCTRLGERVGRWLDPLACSRLLLRLDEGGTGYVTLDALRDVVQGMDLADVIHSYSSDPKLPLLIWVDDSIVRNKEDVRYAQKVGVSVIQLPSTKAAKAWIKVNLEFLKKHDNPGQIRFITDQVRIEPTHFGQSAENRSAGTEMVNFIRDEAHLKAPILVYAEISNVKLTKYVDKMVDVGSIGRDSPKVYQAYVSALGDGGKNDKRWMKYDA